MSSCPSYVGYVFDVWGDSWNDSFGVVNDPPC